MRSHQYEDDSSQEHSQAFFFSRYFVDLLGLHTHTPRYRTHVVFLFYFIFGVSPTHWHTYTHFISWPMNSLLVLVLHTHTHSHTILGGFFICLFVWFVCTKLHFCWYAHASTHFVTLTPNIHSYHTSHAQTKYDPWLAVLAGFGFTHTVYSAFSQQW